MKKKLFTLFLALVASVGTMFAWDYENVQIGDLYYNLDATNQTAEVTYKSYTNYKYNEGWGITTANIPASVTYNSATYSVTSIGGRAFYGCSSLTSVTIPNSVTSIGNNAFYYCTGLTSVTIPNSVTSIGGSAFEVCSGLTSVTIGNSVTSIGDGAFYNCTGLTSVTIGNSVTSIGKWAFYKCTGLTSIEIPNSVTSIGDNAFYKCTGLTSVTIPNSVTSIGDDVFAYCSGFPVIDNIRYADTYLIEAVDKTLSTYTIKDGTKWIGESAFYGCSDLTSVTIPNSVTSIGSFAFVACTSLTSLTIPNSVTSIGIYAFEYCPSLTSVTIPNSVTSIGDSAFLDCTGLTSIIVENGNSFYDSRNNCNAIIETATNTLIVGCMNTIIPNSVTSIGSRAFCGCSGLTSVTIPNSVTYIGWFAFAYCTGLTSVTIEAETPPTLGSDVFYYTNNCPIYVPCGTLEAYKTAWAYADRIRLRVEYTITGKVNDANAGSVDYPTSACGDVVITAVPNNGYHFTQWSDGNTDNPRTIELTQDTTFTAEFAKNSYAISTISANPEWGTTAGDTTALYLDEVEISAIPNYGYHFVRWNDGNTSNPRTVTVTTNETFTATFAKDIYSITKNAEHGSISGNSSAEYLDFVTLTITPDYGYHFTQWSDGLKDNPRIAQITKDTAFTAEFAPDRVGTCGKDLALVWSYDPTNKVLTIGNAGSFTENMEFGVEAPNEMEELVIGNSVTTIGANAFAGIETLKKITIGESVKTIGEQAFYNCVNLETIFNYRPTPTNTYSTAFDGVDKFECVLYVLPSSIDMYKNAAVWRDFYYTYAIGAEETTVTTNDVTVEPQDNAVTLTWPTSNNAASYTIQITKDGVLFCTLIFNANGQLIGIAFAPGRDGEAHAPAALMTENGLQFTVTGLSSGTQYSYSVTAKDANDQTVATYSGEFTTTSEGIATGIDNIDSSSLQGGDRGRLILHNGQIFILRGEKVYTLTGAEVK